MKTQPKWRLILLVLALWMLPVGLGACGEPEVTGVGAEHGEEGDHGAEEGEHAEEGDHATDEEHADDVAEEGEDSEEEAPAAEGEAVPAE